jgi:hypothetical protein
MRGLKKQTKAFFSFLKLISAVFVLLFFVVCYSSYRKAIIYLKNMDSAFLNKSLYDSYIKVFPDKKPANCQRDVNKHWATIKKEIDCETRAKTLMTMWAELA